MAAPKSELQILAEQQADGIEYSVRKKRQTDTVWGSDLDIRAILGRLMTYPEEVKLAGAYVLPPVIIVAGRLAAEEEQNAPYTFLQNHLQSAMENKPVGEVALFIPVNSGQNHWMLVEAHLTDGELKTVKLRDSLKSTDEAVQEKEAFHNVVMAVAAVTDQVKVTGVSDHKQENGHSCMDYTVQSCLQGVHDAGVSLTPDLMNIVTATNADDLRQAVVYPIALKVLFEKNEADESEIAKVLSQHEALEVQKEFDELMAKELDKLFQSADTADKDDDALFKAARQLAFDTMKFKLFPPRDIYRAAEPVSSIKHKP